MLVYWTKPNPLLYIEIIFTFPVVLFIISLIYFKCPNFLKSFFIWFSLNETGKFPIYNRRLYFGWSGAAFSYYDFYDFYDCNELEFEPSLINSGGAALLFLYYFLIIWSASGGPFCLALFFDFIFDLFKISILRFCLDGSTTDSDFSGILLEGVLFSVYFFV